MGSGTGTGIHVESPRCNVELLTIVFQAEIHASAGRKINSKLVENTGHQQYGYTSLCGSVYGNIA